MTILMPCRYIRIVGPSKLLTVGGKVYSIKDWVLGLLYSYVLVNTNVNTCSMSVASHKQQVVCYLMLCCWKQI